MPTKPLNKSLNASSMDILNAIKNEASEAYQDAVPYATEDPASLKKIGAVFSDYPLFQNEFLSALVNRIARVMISSKMYSNPWAVFKQGILEYGETIENIFVDLAKPSAYNVTTAETEIFKRATPDVKAVFHTMNYKEFYKVTIEENNLRMAFTSADGVTDLIARIVDSLYSAAKYDEFLVMKYMLQKELMSAGGIAQVDVAYTVGGTNTTDVTKELVADIKAASNKMQFMSKAYNKAKVNTFSEKTNQYLILPADVDAAIDTEVLAAAFNMDKVTFAGHKIIVDDFSTNDIARLKQIFAEDEAMSTEINALTDASFNSILRCAAVLVDEGYMMIFDNLDKFTEQYNGQGLYWNYWYHQWKTFTVNPF